MTRRKIALITAEPYESCQHRLMQGVFSQCRKYGYDAVVVAQFALACLDFEKDIEGETSIYEYVDYRRFDGVILDPLVLELAGSKKITRKLLPILRGAGVPVVCANQPIDGYPYVFVDSGLAIEKIVDHLVCAHGCERIYAVTGGKGDPVAEQRAEGFRRAMKRNGLDGGNVYYGSFTFEGGEALIGDIAGGAVPLPDAIVCASDFIALGVAKRLKDMGISIPEQVRVTGYDASPEAAVSLPGITTFVPDDAAVGAMAVRHIRELLDGRDDSGLSVNGGELVFCESCGCTMQQEYIRVKLDDILIKRSILGVEKNCSDLKSFNLSYMLEGLTGTETPEECITALGNYTYLLEPYREFRLCLRKDWLTIEDGPSKLPREMKTVLLSYSESARQEKPESRGHQSLSDKYVFEREQLLPELDEEREQPQAFFFLPVHYLDTPFGYGVLQCDITELPRPDYVITSWFRSLNNALNVTRMQYSLRQFSEYDAMTGLMNRRGLKHWLEKTLPECGGEDMLLAVSIDMDGLKYINDNFGHTEGDRGIREVAACVRQTAAKDEICVRTGGDEFLIVGVGRYRQAEVETRLDSLRVLIKETDVLTRGYTFSASIGCAAAPAQGCVPDEVFALADERMYAEKSENHKRMAR